MAIVRIHSRELSFRQIKNHIKKGNSPFFSSKHDDIPLAFKRMRRLSKLFNLTIKSLTGHASFVLKDGKIYIYVEDINSFETVRLITAADKYNFIIENYNAGNTG